MEVKTVGIACDHAGFPLKQFVLEYLDKKGYAVKDFGTYSDESVDYPDFAHPLAEAIESGEVYPGIGICGSGEGMAITLNKHQGVRAGLVWNKEVAQLIRQHNDANVCAIPISGDFRVLRLYGKSCLYNGQNIQEIRSVGKILYPHVDWNRMLGARYHGQPYD